MGDDFGRREFQQRDQLQVLKRIKLTFAIERRGQMRTPRLVALGMCGSVDQRSEDAKGGSATAGYRLEPLGRPNVQLALWLGRRSNRCNRDRCGLRRGSGILCYGGNGD